MATSVITTEPVAGSTTTNELKTYASPAPRPRARREHDPYSISFGLVEWVFLGSVFLSTLELRIVASLTVYDVVVAGLFSLLLVTGRLKFPPKSVLAVSCFFLAFALLSCFRAINPIESATQILQYMFIFFMQLPVVLTLVRTPAMLRYSLIVFVISIMVTAGMSYVFHQEQAGRVMAFYSDNPNRLGYPAAYTAPIVLFLIHDLWRHRRRLFAVVFGLPCAYMLIWSLAASASRSAAVGTVAALMIFLMFRHGLAIDGRVLFRWVRGAAALLAVGYLLFATGLMPETLRVRVERTLSGETSLVDDRVNLAKAGLRSFAESPLIGVGLDNFRYVSRQFEPAATDQLPHNMWIQFLASVGLFGTIMFALILVFWAGILLRTAHNTLDASQREIIWMFLASMAAVLAVYMFLPIMIHRQYWLLYGLGLALATWSVTRIRAPQLSKITPALAAN